MTNKPMLSVERELLDRAVNGGRHEHREAIAELRQVLRDSLDKPAAQHQGEPVPFAWVRFDDDQKAIFTRSKRTTDSEALYFHPTAYRVPRAEQPAPVAVVMPERLKDDAGYSLEAVLWYNLALEDIAKLNGGKQ